MTDDTIRTDNLEIDKKANLVTVSVNPNFYSMEVVNSAIYVMLDDNYFRVEGEPSEEIIVKIKPKRKSDLELTGRKFNNELINYTVLDIRGEKTKDIRAAIVQRALQVHLGGEGQGDTEREKN
ncbi:His-Xaa-Ser system protein HxsD [Candidatus Micrarchaeota archaeon RBG_16_49_10]|nr:MAG: His-Xaa-Ser system protein HxsD [Candidatus Micrarchaeota archaeon RBG_16_49_10]